MKLIDTLSITILLFSAVCHVTASFFTSIEQMTKLVHTHANLVNKLKELIDSQRHLLIQAEHLILDFEYTAHKASLDPKRFVGNPINSFIMIKQLTKDLEEIKDLFITKDQLNTYLNEQRLPDIYDYEGSMKGNNRLISVYNLNLTEWTDARLNSASKLRSLRPLTSFESYEHGRIAYQQEMYNLSTQWLERALEMDDDQNELVDVDRSLELIANSTVRLGDVYGAIELSDILIQKNPNNQHYIDLRNELISQIDNNTLAQPKDDIDSSKDFEALCRGDHVQRSKKNKEQLYCRYMTHHPALFIAPIKQEYLSFDPPMSIFYQVVTESQVKKIKQTGLERLKRSTVVDLDGKDAIIEGRVSENGWIKSDELDALYKLEKLVSIVTNLTLESAEPWQIANYGIGGHYNTHFDFLNPNGMPAFLRTRHRRNRIATWLSYLESPEMGGATVFPLLSIRADPIYRSAVFWYNILPSGNGDDRTLHAGCPVVLGSKWISNKWIHEGGQEFKRPCDLAIESDEYSIDLVYDFL